MKPKTVLLSGEFVEEENVPEGTKRLLTFQSWGNQLREEPVWCEILEQTDDIEVLETRAPRTDVYDSHSNMVHLDLAGKIEECSCKVRIKSSGRIKWVRYGDLTKECLLESSKKLMKKNVHLEETIEKMERCILSIERSDSIFPAALHVLTAMQVYKFRKQTGIGRKKLALKALIDSLSTFPLAQESFRETVEDSLLLFKQLDEEEDEENVVIDSRNNS